ncbi:MAG TPA: ATP-dependent DNA helicase [Acidimicrobiales bacterium]|nr:ATP-dependent DNA helicase [Acidimicrobiales bacterium]
MTAPSAATERPFVPTPEQERAIQAPLLPLLVVAGAGTGKTTAMARRILHLVDSGAARPDQVLGLTFTNKAARNLKEQVRRTLGPDADVTVATYHSFGASLVADHALELGLDPSTTVLNRAQSWQLLFAVFDEFRFERRGTLAPQVLLDDALVLASRCADHLVSVDDLEADCRRVIKEGRWKSMQNAAAKRLELCQVVRAYERRKRERHLLDFGDQVALAVRLLTEYPDLARAYREQHPVVLLDEYQDTNYAQRRMLELLYPAPGDEASAPAVTAVGDDMQSIYAFRGAHLVNILRFTQHFPPATPLPLQTTFRFGPALVTLANRIHGQVEEALPKDLAAPPAAPDTTIECFLAADDAEEAATIAADAKGRGAPWGQTAVLCRKRRLIGPVVAALEEAGVPVEAVGASGLLERPEVVDLVSWLEVLADPSAPVALLRILGGPRYAVGLRDLAALARHARRLREQADGGRGARTRHFLADALAEPAAVADLSDAARQRLGEFGAERHALADAAARLPVLDLAETVLDRSGLWRAAGSRGRENLLRFLDLASRFAPVEGDPGLPAFVEYLQLLDESEEDIAEAHDTDTDAVKVMTVHQAKGLEFDVVHIPGLAGKGSSRIFPDARAGENALTNSSALPWWLRENDGIPSPALATRTEIEARIHRRRLDEEWRLLYVACTRARRHLVLSAAHWYRGTAEPQGPSEFYEFVAAATDVVTERFRHPPADVDPEVAAKERLRTEAEAGLRGPNAVADLRGPNAVAERHARYGEVMGDARPAQLSLDVAAPPARLGPPRSAPTTLSVTGLVTYARCPKQFFWSVVRPLPRRSSAAARLGTEVHRWIQQRSGRQLSLIEPEGDPDLDPDPLPADADLQGRLKLSFLASAWADLDPLRVEAPFVLVLGRHVVRGRIDAVYERDGRLELVDFKTGRHVSGGDPWAGVQLDLYGLAAVDTWAADPARLRTTYCWLRPGEPPLVESADWSLATVEHVRARLIAALDRVAAGDFSPTAGTWCGSCDFLAVCPAGQARQPVAAPDPYSG